MFQAGGLVVVLVEVIRKAYLASVVPVIVDAILNEHQLVVDIIAFVSKGDFPRSRLGEKQRGKILASWVTRKMRTIAQFSIRDPDGSDSQVTEVPEDRISSNQKGGTMMTGSTIPSTNATPEMSPHGTEQQYSSMVPGISEMPANEVYESSIMESPPLVPDKIPLDDDTPTNSRNGDFDPHLLNRSSIPDDPTTDIVAGYYNLTDPNETPHAELSAFNYDTLPPAPKFDSKPTLSLPDIQGDAGLGIDANRWRSSSQAFSKSSGGVQAQRQSYHPRNTSGGGGLRVANATGEDGSDWPQEAMTHNNLGRGESQGSVSRRFDGSGYPSPGYGSAM